MRNRHPDRIEQAYTDALQLAVWHCNGIVPSRRYGRIYGISQNRFENAVGLLRLARVIIKARTWVTDDLGVLKARLASAKQHALTYPAAYHARLSDHAQT